MRRRHKHESRPKREHDLHQFESDLYNDYNEELDDDFDGMSDLASDFYSTDWEDPSGPKHRFSARRQIERRNDLKDMISEFDDWDDFDLRNEW